MTIDYRKAAEEALAHCVETNQQVKDPIGYAQAAATLYLAEQQRLANILTMASFSHDLGDGHRMFTSLESANKWYAEVRDALGLRLS